MLDGNGSKDNFGTDVNVDSKTACAENALRTLRRVDVPEGPTGLGRPDEGRVGAALDVETTGFDAGTDRVIELALRRFRFDDEGRIVRVGRMFTWREDPGFPLPPDVATLTGLSDADLAGTTIDADFAADLLDDVDLVVAHNAAFDRPFVEGRLGGVGHLLWGCSMSQVDWPAHGFDGRKLGYLLNQAGRFHAPHGAPADVDALLTLLAVGLGDGRTALAHLLDRAFEDGWTASAVSAPFSAKDVLKRRGYRWHPGRKLWWREVADGARAEEQAWLEERVYGDRGRALGIGARWDRLDRHRRFA